MPLNLFRKKKEPEQEILATTTEEKPQDQQPTQEAAAPEVPAPEEPKPEPPVAEQESTQEPIPESAAPDAPMPAQEPEPPAPEEPQKAAEPVAEEKPEAPAKTYLKALPLKDLSDLENIKKEVKNGNIIILRITPLASKSIEDVKTAVNDLFQFAESVGGDIARLGEERVVVCPKTVRIWREKSPAPVSSPSDPLPTAA